MLMPGVESRYDEMGQPTVPVYRRLLAVPKGAEVNVEVTRRPRVAHVLSMNLTPFQNPPRIQAAHVDSYWKGDEPPPPTYFADPPFVKDDDTYSTGCAFSRGPCPGRTVGRHARPGVGDDGSRRGTIQPGPGPARRVLPQVRFATQDEFIRVGCPHLQRRIAENVEEVCIRDSDVEIQVCDQK